MPAGANGVHTGTERWLRRVPGSSVAEEAKRRERGDEGCGRCMRGRGGIRRRECDIEFAPWRRACYRQCPTAGPEAICSLCDEIYESFQHSRGTIGVRDREREGEEREGEKHRSRARAAECRCPRVRASSPEHVPLASAPELCLTRVRRGTPAPPAHIFFRDEFFDFRNRAFAQ